jgi:hypothetical protein
MLSYTSVRRAALAVVEYLLGFVALAVFAAVAYAGPQSDERFLGAFKVGALLAAFELAVLLYRTKPANRLIVGANLWLVAGGLAAFFEQWWWLKGYQQLGEGSLFISMLLVGVVTTAFSTAGFVATLGERKAVIAASFALLAGVVVALGLAYHFKVNVKLAGIIPVIALSWFNRFLNLRVRANSA